MILTDLFESQEIHNQDRLDSVLGRCVELIHEKNGTNPKKYGRVAACIIDMKNRKVFGINSPGPDGTRRHAERMAIDAYHKRYGKILPGAIIVTTLSPCNRPMAERDGPSCQDLLMQVGIEKVYSGYMDPSQHSDHPFTEEVTKNDDLWRRCKEFSDSFVHDDLTESQHNTMAADQVLDYVNRLHHDFDIEYSITDHPEWELKMIPLRQLHLDPDGEEQDPYNRVNWVDYDTVRDLIPKIGSVLKSSPIVVDSQGWIIDGNHRAAAAVEAGLDKIPAYVPVKSTVAENMDHSQDDEEDSLVEALESWMMMDYDDQTIKTILSSPEAEPYKDPPGGVQWLYRAIVPRDREMNSIKASGPVIAFATEMAGAITFIQSLETSEDWVIIRKPFDPADFLLDFTAMYEDIVEPDQMSRYEVEDEVWMKAVPAYTKANKQEIVYTSKEHYGDDDWRKKDSKPKVADPATRDLDTKKKDPEWAVAYARGVIGGRWPEAEPYIMKSPKYAYLYALKVIKGRWPEAEPVIMQDPKLAIQYSQLFNLDTPAQNMAENFADGKNPGRKGLAKRSGVNTKASVSSLRKTAKNSSGEKQRMAHWLANMKAGRAKARKK